MFSKNEVFAEYKFAYPAKLPYVKEVKEQFKKIALENNLSYKDMNNLLVVIDEVCANMIKHAYRETEGDMTFEIQAREKGLYITVIDTGRSFNWKSFRPPNLNHYVNIGKKGGLGLWIIRKLTDKSNYKVTGRGNELYLVKYYSKTTILDFFKRLTGPMRSVRERFVLATTVFILTLITSAYIFFINHEREGLKSRFLQYNAELAKSIAESSKERLLKNNYLPLLKILREIKASNANIGEIFVVDAEKTIIAHSDIKSLYSVYGEAEKPLNTVLLQGVSVKKYPEKYELSAVVDFKGEKLGAAYIIIPEEMMSQVMEGKRFNVALMGALMLLASAAGVYMLLGMITKPMMTLREGVHAIGDGRLEHRIELEGEDEFSQIARAFNDMAVKFKGAQESLVEQEKMQKEIAVAKEIQHTLLPKELPETEGFDISALYRSAKEVGGDYYDVLKVGPRLIGVVVADVSGKGVPGSLVMTITRTVMRIAANRNKSAKNVLIKVNDFVKDDMRKGMFVTAFYLVLDSVTRRINFASAGHDALILYRAKEGKVYYVKPKGFPLGISLPEDDRFKKIIAEESVKLEKDDLIAVYTDGITEAMNGKREQYGEERFVKALIKYGNLKSAEIIDAINNELRDFTQGYPQNDDITLVIIKEKKTEGAVLSKMLKQAEKLKKKRMKSKDIEKTLGISLKDIKKLKATSGRGAGIEKMKFLTFEQKKALMKFVVKSPKLSSAGYARSLGEIIGAGVDAEVIDRELKRVNLTSVKKREAYSAERSGIDEISGDEEPGSEKENDDKKG